MNARSDVPGSIEILFDDRARRALLLRPDVPVELPRSRGGRRRFAFARVGLSVVAVSGLLVPASSLAESVPEPAAPVCVSTTSTGDGLEEPCVPPATTPAEPAGPATPPPPPPPPPPASAPAVPDAPQEPVGAPATGPAADAAPVAVAAPRPTTEQPADASSGGSGATAGAGGATRGAAAPATAQHGAATQRSASGRVTSRRAARRRGARSTRRAASAAGAPKVVRRDVAGALAGLPSPAGVASFYVTDEPVIPRFLIDIYKQAGRRYQVPWPILAAINEIETDFGRNVAVSSAGATGWMQFMPATWRAYGVDADHDGVRDPDDPRDAIFAAARYLRASGSQHNLRRAIFAYNHAGWYVDSVLLRAERIAAAEGATSRRLQRLLRAGERRLIEHVLADPRIALYECGRQDVAAGRIDRRVLITLRFLASSGLHPTVSSLECGHGFYTKSGNVSAHSSGNAVDIAAINGIPILGHQGPGSVTDAAIRELLTLRGATRPAQIISLMTYEGADNTLAMADHADHIHVGFRPYGPAS